MPPPQRGRYWRDLVAEAFPGMVADVPEEIRADLARFSLGRIAIAQARSGAARVRRSSAEDRERTLVLHVQRHGRLTLTNDRSVVTGRVGDIIVADDSRPYSIDISAGNDCLILQLPESLLEGEASSVDWHGLLLNRLDPNVIFLRQMLDSLWNQRDRIADLADGIDTLVAVAAEIACRTAVRGSVSEIAEGPVQFARRHLNDPNLSTAMISEATGLSPRAVQKAFARHTHQTPTDFITQQRLARAADRLSADLHQSITGIAFDVGFSDSAFFSRCFRRSYGLTPREWRARTGTR
ncbi:MAG: AraC family transcriptional regulator [Sphingomonas sp. 28-66-16]|nr:MAG: AraC family transcriptional regulator [Sphingomonas sp. 28-66-16]